MREGGGGTGKKYMCDDKINLSMYACTSLLFNHPLSQSKAIIGIQQKVIAIDATSLQPLVENQ